MKTLLKNILLGGGLGSAIFALSGIVFDMVSSGHFELENWSYTKMALGAMLVGAGFSIPSVVYGNDRLPFGLQVLVHMGIGCAVYLAVSFSVGWIPVTMGWFKCGLAILAQLLVSFLIWLAFVLHYKRLAKKMTDRIGGMQD